MRKYDVIVIGGGIFGCSVSYELAKIGKNVLLLEKDYIGAGSTGRCIGGIRQQFSTKGAIKLAMESVKIFSKMKEEFGFDVEFYQSGYLFLAQNEKEKENFLSLVKMQREVGLDVEFLSKEEIMELFPYLNCENVLGGTYCKTDGQCNPFLVLHGYRNGIIKYGGNIIISKVIGIKKDNIFHVKTTDGEFISDIVINSAGPWANDISKFLDIELPIYSERHEAIITEPINNLNMPMIVSYSPSCYFQQLIPTKQIIGCITPENPKKEINHSSSIEFISNVAQRIIKIMPILKEVRVIRAWAGCYTMTPDGIPIIGESEVKGFWLFCAGCGHGVMLGPALGKGLAEIIVKGTSSIPLDEFIYPRKFIKKELLK